MSRLFLIILFVTFLVRCSSDESVPNTPLKVSKMISGDSTSEYVYDGDKLDYIISTNGLFQDYTYSGDLITKVEYGPSEMTTQGPVHFSYDSSQRLVERLSVNPDGISNRIEYIYNMDGTVTAKAYVDIGNGQSQLQNTQEIHFDASGEIAYTTVVDTYNTFLETYIYDNKNNPFKNVTGFDKILSPVGANHNLVSVTKTQNGSVITLESNTYTYNPQGYPSTSTMNLGGMILHRQYRYK